MNINKLPVTTTPLGQMPSGIFVEGSEKVTFFGYTIGDWAEFISIIGAGVSVGSLLFKKIALDPLRSDIQVLSETINRQLKLHEHSLADLGQHLKTHDEELGSHSVRITRLEDHVGIKGDNNNED
jgi:hypothetical protein